MSFSKPKLSYNYCNRDAAKIRKRSYKPRHCYISAGGGLRKWWRGRRWPRHGAQDRCAAVHPPAMRLACRTPTASLHTSACSSCRPGTFCYRRVVHFSVNEEMTFDIRMPGFLDLLLQILFVN